APPGAHGAELDAGGVLRQSGKHGSAAGGDDRRAADGTECPSSPESTGLPSGDSVTDAGAGGVTKHWCGVLLLAALVALGLYAAPLLGQQQTQGPPVLDAIRDSYHNAARAWLPRLVPVAQRLFVLLAGIEFAISGAVWALRRESLDDVAAKFLLKFTLVAFLLALISSFQYWIPPIVNGFAAAGERAIGQSATVSPSDIIDIGREN